MQIHSGVPSLQTQREKSKGALVGTEVVRVGGVKNAQINKSET
jgi:hypothetical protein